MSNLNSRRSKLMAEKTRAHQHEADSQNFSKEACSCSTQSVIPKDQSMYTMRIGKTGKKLIQTNKSSFH